MTEQMTFLSAPEPANSEHDHLRAVLASNLAMRDEGMHRARLHAMPDPRCHDPFLTTANVRHARRCNHAALRVRRALRRMGGAV